MPITSDRAGIRYENSPNQALFENNELHGNGRTERRGGIDIRDSQNARVINNNLGPATIAGVSYAANGDRVGIRATDSGRSDRVNLSNVDVVNNKMNGDSIITCGGAVACSGDTNVGSRLFVVLAAVVNPESDRSAVGYDSVLRSEGGCDE